MIEQELEVVWHGGMALLPPRPSKPGDTWTSPNRLYNRKQKPAAEPQDDPSDTQGVPDDLYEDLD